MQEFEDKLTSIRLGEARIFKELQLIRNATELHSTQSQADHHTLQDSIGLLGNGIVQDGREDNTTIVPRGYYPIKTRNKLAKLPSNPCAEIERRSKSDVTPSGYYWVQNAAGASVHVYCNMNRSCCGYTGGWVRVGYLNMTNSSHRCPGGCKLYNSPRRCGFTGSYGCTSVTFPSQGVQYQRVCGRITAYQKGTTDAFYNYYSTSSPVTKQYVDGVSITHGTHMKHIWTFAAANDELRADQWRCPCSRIGRNFTGYIPPYVGDDYFCDAGTPSFPDPAKIYTTNPIWDGSGCGSSSSCCTFNSPPWFCKELARPTTDNLQLRVCRDQHFNDEDVQIELIELYIG